jgi:hypothetical protein
MPFLNSVEKELEVSGLQITVEHKIKHPEESIRSAFLKTNTLETFIRIGLDEPLKKYTQSNEVIKIKLEVDIDPPSGFSTEIRYITAPIPFSVRTYTSQDLFAGKMHALLCRPYKVRVKGRDWYDFIWYVAKGIRLNLTHLESRMRQSGHYTDENPLTQAVFINRLQEKIAGLNIANAREDIRRFIQDPRETDGWSTEFFMSLVPKVLF